MDEEENLDNGFLDDYQIMDYYQIKGQTIFGSSWKGCFQETYQQTIKNSSNQEMVKKLFGLIEYIKVTNEFPHTESSVKNLKQKNSQGKYSFSIKRNDLISLTIEQFDELKEKEKDSYIIKQMQIKYPNLFDYLSQKQQEYITSKIKKNEIFNGYQRLTDDINSIAGNFYKSIFRDLDITKEDKKLKNRRIYLFQIYNKDFSKKKRGTDNLHTIYWKALFEEENMKSAVLKLAGGAELFYRKESIKKPFVHKEGTILKHKRHKDFWEELELPISSSIHTKKSFSIHTKKDLKGKPVAYSTSEHTGCELILYKGKTIGKIVKNKDREITKDKRFTKDKFLFHCSIQLNYNSQKNNKKEQIIETFKDKNIKIIGIDRGERHLAYYTLINQEGKIEKQGSLNKIISKDNWGNELETDYHKLLLGKAKQRDEARKSWDTIEGIKDLKNGYISQVVHQISKMAVEENAIIVFEDLNQGFKRSRVHFEQQTYQKLEKALIDKLNYYVDKSKPIDKLTGVLKGLQLTPELKKFGDMKRQQGIIFYVNPSYTSNICPKTGFVNLIDTKYKSIEKTKELFEKFSSICFNHKKDYFEFKITDYRSFNSKAKSCKQDWAICTYGKRLENIQNKITKKWETQGDAINLSKELKDLLSNNQINFESSYCLKEQITKQLNKNNADFAIGLMRLLKLTLQMRNSRIGTDEDWMVSPVKASDGTFFESKKVRNEELPKNADANGAYHIALKGLFLLKNKKFNDCFISLDEWFKFRQSEIT